MDLGFSFVGLIFLVMLFVPNIVWSNNKPKDYEKYVINENKVLSILESAGEVLVVCFSLILINVSYSSIIFLILAFILMILYEAYWIRYFKSNQTMKDMYSSFLAIPVAGATLPVLAFMSLGIYESNVFLIIATIILGIGHIGIHLSYKNVIQ